MKKQRKELHYNMQGKEVAQLQEALRKLGFAIDDDEGHFGDSTRDAVIEIQKRNAKEPTGVFDQATADLIATESQTLPAGAVAEPAPESYVVYGQVLESDGHPFEGLVQAFDKDLRTEQLLGQASTDADGRYEIIYGPSQFSQAEKKNADLLIRVFRREGELVASSLILFNAPPVATIDIIIGAKEGRGLSEYERFMAELTPLLAGQNVAFAKLTEDEQHQDVTFLTAESGINPLHIAFLVIAHRLAEATGISPEAFYGFFRQNLPTRLAALLSQHFTVLRSALEAAIASNIIPSWLTGSLDQIMARLRELAVEQSLKGSDTGEKYSLGSLLDTAMLSADHQKAFLAQYVEHEGSIEDFWAALGDNPLFADKDQVGNLQFVLQLGALTRNHLPLVKRLYDMRNEGELNSIRDLVKLDEQSWLQIIKEQLGGAGFPPDMPGKDDDERAMNYAKGLTRVLEDAFPTAALAHRIESNGFPGRDDLVAFFSKNPEFELTTAKIDKYLKDNPAALSDVVDHQGVTHQLKGMQRLYRVLPSSSRYESMKTLISDGVHSAQSIVRKGQQAFLKQYGGKLGEEQAKAIYANASRQAALSLTLFAKYATAFNSIQPFVMGQQPQNQVQNQGDIQEMIPNWASLFGPLELCDCDHCRSVYSPAAYLVDVLAFLGNNDSALATLTERRPDIRHIELSCENTNTPLPYIDLVNEVLEMAIAPMPLEFSVPLGSHPTHLDNMAIPSALKQGFASNGITLSDGAVASVEAKGSRWLITDGGWRYSLRKEGGQLNISTVPQARGTAEELSANPEYINTGAYTMLGEQVYPFNLPFNLWTEEARAHLEHLGVSRHRLMEIFHKDAPPAELTDVAIASEYLGLTGMERQIITGAATQQPWEYWGLAETGNTITDPMDITETIQGSWIELLGRVPVFLQRSGLDYKELLALIGTKFINPNGQIGIASADPNDQATCNLSKLRITNLSAAVLNKAHRFVRLRRKLEWTTQELDKTITALAAADLNESFLVRLSHIQRLRSELKKVSVIQMLSWWGPIDTTAAGGSSLYEQLFLNKAVTNPVDDAFRPEKLAAGSETISGHAPALLAALGISEDDLSLLTRNDVAKAALNLDEAEITTDALNLENLSHLYRIVSLARVLKLSVRNFLIIKALSGINPFDPDHTEETLRFLRAAQKVRSSAFKIEELDYLLRHWYTESSGVAAVQQSIPAVLEDIRSGLKRIAEDTSLAPDPDGELTRKKLALLKWDNATIEAVIATLKGAIVYEAELDALPQGVIFPDELNGKLLYDADNKKLRFSGPMTLAEQAELLSLSDDASYEAAVNELFNEPRQFISNMMRAFEWPTFSAPLSALPQGIVFPNELKNKVYYDPAAQALRFAGPVAEADKSAMAKLSPDQQYQQAVDSLFNQSNTFIPETNNQFITPADASLLLDDSEGAEQRFNGVLSKLLPRLRKVLSESLVEMKMADALKLDAEMTEQLLTRWVDSPSNAPLKAIADFLAPAFAESNPNIKLTAESFPDQFGVATLLMKISMLLSKLNVTPDELAWMFDPDYGPSVGWLNLNELPLETTVWSPAMFAAWGRLVDLFTLRDQLPMGKAALKEVFALVRNPVGTAEETLSDIGQRMGWNDDDLKTLAGPQGFGLAFPDDYKDERAFLRLSDCFAVTRRFGVSAAQCLNWIKADLLAEDARSIKQAVKAKYDNEQWLAIAKPLRDVLREKQRTALVSYLAAHPDPAKGQTWQDANGIYQHFLIDVEMSACAKTSRVKQAISSVQLFVQRCLMNLEPEVTLSPQEAKQWKWMKNYRVWEANRKVFLYPENWIEPELRDDKSPFFKDMETQLLQNELTMEAAEDAFLNYLEKLDEVARLEVVGMFHQKEIDEDDKLVADILHVFARTRGTPNIYFYRRWVDSSHWTAWEKVDVDIEGNHLIPVVWNRRLHLFWPVFTEKAKDEIPSENATAEEKKPEKYWEVQLAWSEYKNGKWSAKKVSDEYVTFQGSRFKPDQLFLFKGFIRSTGDLTIRVYRQDLMSDSYVFMDLFPWYEFRFTGCHGSIVIKEVLHDELNMLLPPGTIMKSSMLVEEPKADDADSLRLLESKYAVSFNKLSDMFNKKSITVLKKTPGIFRLLSPHQDFQFGSQRPFFYQDHTRTFFVIPSNEIVYPEVIFTPGQIDPILIDKLDDYFIPIEEIDPAGPVAGGDIGQVFEPALPVSKPALGEASNAAMVPSSLTSFGNALARGFDGSLPGTASIDDDFRNTILMRDISVLLSDASLGEAIPLVNAYYTEKRYKFETFYHPYVCYMMKQLKRYGIDGLLRRENQLELFDKVFFESGYKPEKFVKTPYPVNDVDFSYGGAYSAYNWELFFHVPMLIAARLSKNQRFEEAQKWFHYIFDPTDRSPYEAPKRFWKVRPFFDNVDAQKTVEDLMKLLNEGDEALARQVDEWKDNPFNPHLIARLRVTAYQKSVVMKYIDNLIAWGDQLFRRDSIESINEATQLYVLAAEILGKRPDKVAPRVVAPPMTFNQLAPNLDAFSNALIEIENLPQPVEGSAPPVEDQPQLPQFHTFYFCIPRNDKLLGYWDTIADRLFKIRHCMTIEGVVRQLPLFEPPIDPGLLVKAFAMGADIGSILNDMSAPLPHYRFNVMSQKATELCADVKALGAALLSVLEKRDAEELALLRSSHEIKLLAAVKEVKKQQIEEAKQTLEGLKKAKQSAEIMQAYYNSREFMSEGEKAQLTLMNAASVMQAIAQGHEVAAAVVRSLPEFVMGGSGWAGSPVVTAQYGGANVAGALEAFGRFMGMQASIIQDSAMVASILAGYQRRADEWKLQAEVVAKEIEQIEKNIAAAQIRLAIAERDLRNHELEVESAKETEEYMRNKFTNRELYDWMVSQVSALYFQSYQLAYDIAKRAEKSYRYELGLSDSNFIQFGYWDSLKKGLLAGEKLHYDIKRMETAYLDQNKREYEITKHVSLAALDPIALVKLKQTGECFISLPETLFDLDYPGHFMRRIKSVGLTIPCVTGPYTSVSCTLSLLKNSVRKVSTLLDGVYGRQEEDPRFADAVAAIQSVVTSNAQNDTGLFEPGLADQRYLPFEGAGVISEWHIEMPKEFRQFDYDTISDVILQIRYTSREGGGALKIAAIEEMKTAFEEATLKLAENRKGLSRLFSVRQEFPGEWHKFLHAQDSTRSLDLELSIEKFPFQFRDKAIQIDQIGLLLKRSDAASGQALELFLTAPGEQVNDPAAQTNQPTNLQSDITMANLLYAVKKYSGGKEPGKWLLKARGSDISPIKHVIEDIGILCTYSVTEPD